jgi:transposase
LVSRPQEATDILSRIAEFYHHVEKFCVEMEPHERRHYRLQHAPANLEGLFSKRVELKANTIPSEPLRKAVDYGLRQRDALQRSLKDGRLSPDNHLAEKAMRPIALSVREAGRW